MRNSLGESSMSRLARSSTERAASARLSIASDVETSWMTTLSPRARSARIAGTSEGSFMPIRSWQKNRCLVDSKIDSAAALAPLL